MDILATGRRLSVYISSYKELNPSKSPFRLGARPGNAGLVWGALIAGE